MQEVRDQAIKHVENALRLIETPRPSPFGNDVNQKAFDDKYREAARQLLEQLRV